MISTTQWPNCFQTSLGDLFDVILIHCDRCLCEIVSGIVFKKFDMYVERDWYSKGFPFYGVTLTYADSAHF